MKPFQRTTLVVVILPVAVVVLFSLALSVRPGASKQAGSAPAAVSPPNATYVRSFEKWKAEQTEDLKQNWLPLAGLYWLKPGANTFGSDPSNAAVFPKGPDMRESSFLKERLSASSCFPKRTRLLRARRSLESSWIRIFPGIPP
jgi:hypothetical protein